MTCEDYQLQASLYVDGELAEAGSERLFEHLSTCLDCRSFLRGVLEIRSKIHDDLLKEQNTESVNQSSGLKMTFMLPLVVLITAMLLILGIWDVSLDDKNTPLNSAPATPWNLIPQRSGGQF